MGKLDSLSPSQDTHIIEGLLTEVNDNAQDSGIFRRESTFCPVVIPPTENQAIDNHVRKNLSRRTETRSCHLRRPRSYCAPRTGRYRYRLGRELKKGHVSSRPICSNAELMIFLAGPHPSIERRWRHRKTDVVAQYCCAVFQDAVCSRLKSMDLRFVVDLAVHE